MQSLKQELEKELLTDILPYWINNMIDHEHGGFYGRIDGKEHLHKQANKGAVLNARILWTFSAAYRLFKNPEYLDTAERAFHYILEHFIDKEYGGVYWELDYRGNPINLRKQVYAQGFALYGFSEFYRTVHKPEALEEAVKIFRLLEKYAYDPVCGGYIEALNRNWQPIEDMRLSERDVNAPQSMNTHLHIIEPYTNLLRVWHDPELMKAHRQLIQIFRQHIISPQTHHLILFFNEEWKPLSENISYGHDIECAWLLYEAAEASGDAEIIAQVKPLALAVAEAAYEGLQTDGSMIYEKDEGHTDTDRHWWVQAETVVGSVYAYKISGNQRYLDIAKNCWKYIHAHILDQANGEWFWSVSAYGQSNSTDDKAGFWKCPYHNARMCMEIWIE